MTFEEYCKQSKWFGTYESDQMMLDAWNHQQAKIDELEKQLISISTRLDGIKNSEIRPKHSEYDFGWKDCSITVLRDLQELLK